MGEGPLEFRVTDVEGSVLADAGIPLLDDAEAVGAVSWLRVSAAWLCA
jgi:expansin (peptidoglycan-binding protein)